MDKNTELIPKNKLRRNTKTKVAFWLLIIPYIMLVVSYAIIFLSQSDIVLAAVVVALVLYPPISICFCVVSIVLQIISLCQRQSKTKNTVMLVFSVFSILFTCFYVWFLTELGAAV